MNCKIPHTKKLEEIETLKHLKLQEEKNIQIKQPG